MRNSILTFVVLVFSVAATAAASSGQRTDLFSVPPLYPQKFESLGFSGGINKTELVAAIDQFSREYYQKAFVDLGDMSDFMHGHLLMSASGDRAIAILFHTQEFPNVRNGQPYEHDGVVIDAYARNYIYWLSETSGHKVGEISQAKDSMSPVPKESPTTVSSDMLDPKVFGDKAAERSVTFFFYRFSCDERDERATEGSNIFNVALGNSNACLAMVSETCNTEKEESTHCSDELSKKDSRPALKPISH